MFAYLSTFSLLAAILLIIGIVLVVVEMMVPGFGLPGIAGFILIILGILFQAKTVAEGLLLLMVVVGILGIIFFFVLRSFRKGKLAKSPLILNTSIKDTSSDQSTKKLSEYIGKTGTTVTALRPVGTIDIDGERLSAVGEGVFIDAGVYIRVLGAENNSLIVRTLEVK